VPECYEALPAEKKAFLSLNGKNDITAGSELIAAELWLVSQFSLFPLN